MSNATDYAYANPIPGSKGASVAGAINEATVVATGPYAPSSHPFQDAVTSPMETTTGALNPAFEGASATYAQQEQEMGQLTPAQEAALPPSDSDNPGALENARDTEGDPMGDRSAQAPVTMVAPVATAGGTAGTASVAYTAPTDPDGYAITSYRTTLTSSNGGATVVASGTATPIAVTGLTSGKLYTATVAAENVHGYGAESPASAAITAA